jgi:hypothetical protein
VVAPVGLGEQVHGFVNLGVVAGQLRGDHAGPAQRVQRLGIIAVQALVVGYLRSGCSRIAWANRAASSAGSAVSSLAMSLTVVRRQRWGVLA